MVDSTDRLVEFLRKRDYVLISELGEGACGKTVLLRDDLIDQLFVCKKYSPHKESARQSLFENFVREIKLLLDANHHNVVRIFTYFLYPDSFAGYILMEHVNGQDIFDFLSASPERASDVFLQSLKVFAILSHAAFFTETFAPPTYLCDLMELRKS